MASSIYTTLQGYMSGTTLTLPATAFGAGGIQDVITKYFNGTLVISNVNLVQTGGNVSFNNAVVTSAPLNTMTVDASFTQGASSVDMLLTATPPANWNFADGWPLLANDWMGNIGVNAATFALSSIAQGTTAKGLNFNGTFDFSVNWADALWLLSGSSTINVSGSIDQKGEVPIFSFTSQLASVSIPPYLNTLSVSLQIACAAIVGNNIPGLPPAGGSFIYPWAPQASIGLLANVQLNAAIDIPIFIDLSAPNDAITISADVSSLTTIAFKDFANLFPGVNFQSVLPNSASFNPGSVFTLQKLVFTISPAAKKIISVEVIFGTTASWPVTNGIAVGPVNLQFCIMPGGTPPLSVSLLGDVSFPGGAIQLGAYYPNFTFTGDLTPGSQIKLTDLMQKLLPINTNATLILDKLDFVVTPSSGNFSLVTGLTGNWSIPVGVATVNLTNAWLDLNRNKGGTTGAMGLTGNLVITGSKTPVAFAGSWTLPGEFNMSATFPAIDFNSLAQSLSGTTLPSGVPNIGIDEGAIAIALNTTTNEYTFSLAATATVNGNSIGSGVLQVRKTPTGYGYLVGFIIPETWSPANIWSGLSGLFNDLTFTNSGLLISTLPNGTTVNLPNMKMPSLPSNVNPGFVFFSTLALQGNILGGLSKLFANTITFNLLAVVDTANPANSVFEAVLPLTQTNGAIQFTDIAIELKPGAASFSLSANAILTIQGDVITLEGLGTITLTPPSLSFSMLVANWINPFGIKNLTVDTFGLQVKVNSTGVDIGFLGSFIIGSVPRTFTMVIGGEIIDFEAPGAIVFELDNNNPANPLMLYDLINQFTTLDVSNVPVLNKIGFNSLEFWVVDDPSGFIIGNYNFPPGIGVVGDIFIYSWEAKFNIQVNESKGIIASGSINKPITLAGIFSLSDTTGTTGPSGSIDTSAITTLFTGERMVQAKTRLLNPTIANSNLPYFELDGKLTFLGITESIKAQASKNNFDFQLTYNFYGLANASLACSLVDDKNFSANASIGFDLNVTVGPYSVNGVELIPQINIKGPSTQLSLQIIINPTVIAQLNLDLDFIWSSLHCGVGFTLSIADIANDLSNLYQAMITWLQSNVDKLFSGILSDVKKWIAAIKAAFTDLANDIDKVANALANYFNTAVDDAAAFLKELAFEFEAIVEALVKYFNIAFDAAIKIVEGLWNDCSMTNAFNQASTNQYKSVSMRDMEYEYTRTQIGQRILLVKYGYGDEIMTLLEPHPVLRDRLIFHNTSPHGADNLQQMIDTQLAVFTTISSVASAQLKEHIEILIPQLYAARKLSHYQFLQVLANETK